MAAKLTLTASQVGEITLGRKAGASWKSIGQHLGGVADTTAKAAYLRALAVQAETPQDAPADEPVVESMSVEEVLRDLRLDSLPYFPATAEAAPESPAAPKSRTGFYLTVISKPMTAVQVDGALANAGWKCEGMPKVVATLGYLVRRGHLTMSGNGKDRTYALAAR